MRVLIASVLALTVAAVQPAHAADMIGYRGDTTGVFRDSPVPAQIGVLWRAPLPNWSYSFPTVVDGKVFCMSEPGWEDIFPVLLCFDAASGKELWRLELDHLPYTGLPKAKQDEMRAEMDRRWRWWRDTWTNGGGKSPHKTKTDPEWQSRSGRKKPLNKLLVENGMYAGSWWGWGMSLIGHTFPTPVSDGQHLYVVTGRGTQACVTFDGQIRWLTRCDYDTFRGEDCRNARSPLLWRNLLICSNGVNVRAYDKTTGREVWRVQTGASHTVATPVFITLNDTPFIYTCVNTFIRLPDGQKMTLEGGIGEGVHTPTVNDEDDIIYFTGNGEHCSFTHSHKGKGLGMPTAVKFTLDGNTIRGKILWQNSKDRDKRENEPPLYFNGKLYCGSTVFDARTGKVLGKGVPKTKHVLLTDGRQVFGVDAGYDKRAGKGTPGTLRSCTLDGRPGLNVELPYKPDPARCKAKTGKADWGFSNSCPFTIAYGRVYVRGFDELYCLGVPGQSIPRTTARRNEEPQKPASDSAEKPQTTAQPAPKPAVSEAELKKWEPALLALITHRVAAGQKPQFTMESMRRSVTITGVTDDRKIKILSQGLQLEYACDRLSLRDRAEIAGQVAHPSQPRQSAVAAFFHLAAGDARGADVWLARAGKYADAIRKSVQ